MDALGDQEERLVDAEHSLRLFDLAADRVGAAHELQRHALAELDGPLVPEPLHVGELRPGLGVGGRAHRNAAPAALVPAGLFDAVTGGLGAVRLPQLLAEVHLVAEHDRRAAITCPEHRRAHRHGEPAVQRRVRRLQRARCDAHLVDRHVGVDAGAVVGIHGVGVGVEVVVGEAPELALVGERVVLEGGEHHVDELLEVPAVVVVCVGAAVPLADRSEIGADLELVHPAMLVAAHRAEAEPPAGHVVERRHLLGDPQRVVGGGHVSAGDRPQPSGVLGDPGGHQVQVVGDLEPLDLQVMLRVAESVPAVVVGEASNLGDLAEHALVVVVVEPCEACFQLVAPTDRAVHEQAEFHRGSRRLCPQPSAICTGPEPRRRLRGV